MCLTVLTTKTHHNLFPTLTQSIFSSKPNHTQDCEGELCGWKSWNLTLKESKYTKTKQMYQFT